VARLLLLVLAPLAWLALLEAFAWAAGYEPLVEDPAFRAQQHIFRCRWGRQALERLCDAPWSARGRRSIFVYGGSSVVVSPGRLSLSTFLQQGLDAESPDTYVVRNMALPCRDSFYVRECVERSLDAGPDLIVVYSGHNDFGGYMVRWPRSRMLMAHSPWLIDLRGTLARTRLMSLLTGASRADPQAPDPFTLADADFDLEASQRVVLRAYGKNLSRVADLALQRGIPLLLVTVVSNLSEWPFARRDWDAVLARVARGEAPRWLALYAAGIELTREARGREALAAFKQSRDLLYPGGRASSALNELLRALAAERDDVHLVDFELELDEIGAREGIGCNLFEAKPPPCDHVHPNRRTNRLLGHAVARRILALDAAEAAGS
jgi:hypothetical protein